MAKRFPIHEIEARFTACKASNTLFLLAGAGLGLSAKCEEIGGADMILIDSIGRYRMNGRGSLAGYFGFENANDIVGQMSKQMLGMIEKTPVIAGVSAADPFCDVPTLIDQYITMGYSGIANNPSVGCFEEEELVNLEKTDMGYLKEVAMLDQAHQKGLYTVGFAWRPEQAVLLAKASVDLIVLHLGVCVGGLCGVDFAPTLDESIVLLQEMVDAVKATGATPHLLCHGGVLIDAPTVTTVMQAVPDLIGFYGASALERLPTEQAIMQTGIAFKALTLPTAD